ncbi:TPA: hypothetical protein N0F65_005006 [Lagenidium giganteum]|uniref:Potassium channel domain-containing protein n=1 Tax=Lagenidium giganteum TaxID=4803 RepID=A0AAV2ZCH5_9STRA|nr:TPA: hypothetical protein N0F65_005006 [Lagenidium giganteum]
MLNVRAPDVVAGSAPAKHRSLQKLFAQGSTNAVATPPRLINGVSESPFGDDGDKIYLRARWASASLRHPTFRVAVCVARLLCCFFLCASSPLMNSLHQPAFFPVYSNLVGMVLGTQTAGHLTFMVTASLFIVLFVRFVVYRKFFQPVFNWHVQYRHATRAYSRVSGLPVATTDETDPYERLPLQCFWSKTCEQPIRLRVCNRLTAQGSITICCLFFPFCWSLLVRTLHRLLHPHHIEKLLLPTAARLPVTQLELQSLLYQCLMTLNVLVLILTVDRLLQDFNYCRATYSNWLLGLRRMYRRYPFVRYCFSYTSVAGLGVAAIYFQVFDQLRLAWIAVNLRYIQHTQPWFSNESWRALMSGVMVSLDLLWLMQDWHFPTFSSAVGVKAFGLWKDHFAIKIGRWFVGFTAKWTSIFIVVAVLLPLDVCQFYQVVGYAPKDYSQYVDEKSFRVFPLMDDQTVLPSLPSDEHDLLVTGSLSRYFGWPLVDRFPAMMVIGLVLSIMVWLRRKEYPKMCFSSFLGASVSDHALRQKTLALQTINNAVSGFTKRTLRNQRALKRLHALRAQMDTFCAALAVFSVTIAVLQFRSLWKATGGAGFSKTAIAGTFLQSPGETYGVLLVLVTLLLVYQLYLRYHTKLEIMILRNQLPEHCLGSLLRPPSRLVLRPFLVELLLCAFCLPPMVHGVFRMDEPRYFQLLTSFHTNACPKAMFLDEENHSCDLMYSYPWEIVNVFVLIRLYWLIRVLRNALLRRLLSQHVLIIGGVLKDLPMDSLLWNLRLWLSLAPGKLLVTVFFLFWFTTAAIVSILERPYPSLLDDQVHSLWLTIVTMSSVGYGDIYPITAYGRMAVLVGAVFGGTMLLSLMISVFLEALKGSKDEHEFVTAVEKMKWQQQVWNKSTQLIACAWRQHKKAQSTGLGIKRSAEVFAQAHAFKLLRKNKPRSKFEQEVHVRIATLSNWKLFEMPTWAKEWQEESTVALNALETEISVLEHAVQDFLRV